MSTITATPAKLKSGAWGARVQGSVAVGDTITIRTQAGKTWNARVTAIVWSGDGVTLCATESADRPEPVSVDGAKAIMGRHWSTRGRGPMERLCAAGCGRRVSARYAECYACHRESLEAM